MSVWTILSAASILAAGIPPAYFSVRLHRANRSAAGLALLLAASLMIHGVFHALESFAITEIAVLGAEAISALLILGFAFAYWPLRGRR